MCLQRNVSLIISLKYATNLEHGFSLMTLLPLTYAQRANRRISLHNVLTLTLSACDYLPFNWDRMGTADSYSADVQQKFSEGIEERPS